jgi:hypothetical protein
MNIQSSKHDNFSSACLVASYIYQNEKICFVMTIVHHNNYEFLSNEKTNLYFTSCFSKLFDELYVYSSRYTLPYEKRAYMYC